mgnify:CR=1 FL=1
MLAKGLTLPSATARSVEDPPAVWVRGTCVACPFGAACGIGALRLACVASGGAVWLSRRS